MISKILFATDGSTHSDRALDYTSFLAQKVGAKMGSRGAGEVAGILVGSVSQRVSTHANKPVLIVH